jgi:hypothetical protein
MLITAASLAATVGGWAVIGAKESQPIAPPPPPAPTQVVAPAVTIKLAPLPTLVPPITPQPRSQLVTINQPRSAAAVAARPVAPQAAAPQAAAPTELVLRDVSAPVSSGAPQVRAGGSAAAPAPVVNTGSSR